MWLTDDEEGGVGWVESGDHRASADTDPRRLHEKGRVCITVDIGKGDFRRAESVTNPTGQSVLWSVDGGSYKYRWWVSTLPIAVADFVAVELDGVRYASVSKDENGLEFLPFDE